MASKSRSNGREMISSSSVYNKSKRHQRSDSLISLRNSLLQVEYQWACDMLGVGKQCSYIEIHTGRFAHVGWLSSVS